MWQRVLKLIVIYECLYELKTIARDIVCAENKQKNSHWRGLSAGESLLLCRCTEFGSQHQLQLTITYDFKSTHTLTTVAATSVEQIL